MNKELDRGFTLIEVLAALALFGFLMAGLMSVFWCGFYGYEKEVNQSELQYDVRQARYRIIDDFRQSRTFVIKDKDRKEVTGHDEGVRLYLVKDSEEIEFYVYNNQLYRALLSSHTVHPVASNISAITFTSPGAGLLELNITAALAGHELKTGTTCRKRID